MPAGSPEETSRIEITEGMVTLSRLFGTPDAGLTGDGFQAMLLELGGEGTQALGQLSDQVLGKLARAGASAETVKRWNAAATAAHAESVIDEAEGLEPEPDPEDLPALWAA